MATGVNCAKCGGPLAVSAADFELCGVRVRFAVICTPCDAARQAEEDRITAKALEDRLEVAWIRMCDEDYRETDPDHPDMDQPTLKEVLLWKPNPEGVGLALTGPTGSGKTRMCWLLVKRLHFKGVDVQAIRGVDFAALSVAQFSDDADEKRRAKQELCRIEKAAVLFVDDLGKERFTQRFATQFYTLVEKRMATKRPILFTSQLSGKAIASLIAKQSDEVANANADAILRRLTARCDFIKCERRASKRRAA